MAIIPVSSLRKYKNTLNFSTAEYVLVETSKDLVNNIKQADVSSTKKTPNIGFVGSLSPRASQISARLLSLHPDVCPMTVSEGSDYPALLMKIFTSKAFRVKSQNINFHSTIYNNITNGNDLIDVIRESTEVFLDHVVKRKIGCPITVLISCHYTEDSYIDIIKSVWPESNHVLVGDDIQSLLYERMRDITNVDYIRATQEGLAKKYIKDTYEYHQGRFQYDICFSPETIENPEAIIEDLLSKMNLDREVYDFDKAADVILGINPNKWKSEPQLVEFFEAL